MDAFFRKNESETNEITAKVFLIIYGFILLIGAFDWTGIFDIQSSMIWSLIVVSTVPLLLPAILIYGFHVNMPWLKYLLITMVSIVVGAVYCIFTFQAVIVFVVPSIVASFYMNKRLLNYSGVITCVVIIISHAITGVYLFQPHIEPFLGMRGIMQYGAVPRCMQYLLYFGLLWILNKRHLDYMEKMVMTFQEKKYGTSECENADNDNTRKEFEQLLLLLTDREKEVFMLMIHGCTNMQIAERLCLSMGTVKNYVSTIYDKTETRERNYIILKYSRFYEEYDQSNT